MKKLFKTATAYCKLPTATAYCLLLLSLLGTGAAAGQPPTVTVSTETADYANKKEVSFTVTWTAAPTDNKIWVIVDYIKVSGVTLVDGWQRAQVSGATATGSATAATVTGQLGFWLNTSGEAGSADVTAALQLASEVTQFNWCPVAFEQPPGATVQPDGSYALKGSEPFRITYNGGSTATVDGYTFNGGCMEALADKSDNPAAVITQPDPGAGLALEPATQEIYYGHAATLTATATNAASYSLTGNGSDWQTATTFSVSPTTSTTYTLYAKTAAGCTASLPDAATVTVNALPTLETTDPAPRCGAGTVMLSATAGGGTTTEMSYAWIVGGTAQTTTMTNTYTATVPEGSTTYSVTVTNSAGVPSDAATGTITAHELPAAPTGASSNTVCGAGNIDFSAGVSGEGITIDWYNAANGGSVQASGTLTHTAYLSPGSYTFYAEARNTATGCVSATWLEVSSTIYAVPYNLSLSSATICNGESATLTASASGAASYSLNGSTWTTATTFAVNPTSTTNYTLYVKSSAGCTATKANAATVTVNAAITAPGLIASATVVCAGEAIQFTPSGNSGGTYDWACTGFCCVGDGKPEITPFEPGIYSAKVRVVKTENGLTCYSDYATEQTVYVNAILDAPTLTPSPAAACAGSAITFTASQGSGTYDWILTGFTGTVGNVSTQTTPDTAGTYKARVRSTKKEKGITCYSSYSAEETVTVHPVPANLSLSSATICAGESATLTAVASGAASYSINNQDWQTAATFAVNPTSETNYTLYIKSSTGCTATTADAATVTVNPLPAAPTAPVNRTRCDKGDVSLSATVPDNATIDWYTAVAGTSPVTTGNTTCTVNLNTYAVQTWYAEARFTATGCVSVSRTAVTGTAGDPAILGCPGAAVTLCGCMPGTLMMYGRCFDYNTPPALKDAAQSSNTYSDWCTNGMNVAIALGLDVTGLAYYARRYHDGGRYVTQCTGCSNANCSYTYSCSVGSMKCYSL